MNSLSKMYFNTVVVFLLNVLLLRYNIGFVFLYEYTFKLFKNLFLIIEVNKIFIDNLCHKTKFSEIAVIIVIQIFIVKTKLKVKIILRF